MGFARVSNIRRRRTGMLGRRVFEMSRAGREEGATARDNEPHCYTTVIMRPKPTIAAYGEMPFRVRLCWDGASSGQETGQGARALVTRCARKGSVDHFSRGHLQQQCVCVCVCVCLFFVVRGMGRERDAEGSFADTMMNGSCREPQQRRATMMTTAAAASLALTFCVSNWQVYSNA
jgi:hypothetical protein